MHCGALYYTMMPVQTAGSPYSYFVTSSIETLSLLCELAELGRGFPARSSLPTAMLARYLFTTA